jgi:hypothetical protein
VFGYVRDEIRWNKLLIVMQGSFLQFCLGIFLNLMVIAKPHPANYVSLIVTVIGLAVLCLVIVNLIQVSRRVSEKN